MSSNSAEILQFYEAIAHGERLVLYVNDDVEFQVVETHWAVPMLQKYKSNSSPNETFSEWLTDMFGEWDGFPLVYVYTSHGEIKRCGGGCEETCAFCLWRECVDESHRRALSKGSTSTEIAFHHLIGSSEFLEIFPDLLKNKDASLEENIIFPACLIPPSSVGGGLFLGSYFIACQSNLLQRLHISAIVNCTQDLPYPPQCVEMSKLRIAVDDSLSENLLPYLPEAVEFIEAELSQNHNVFVHCSRGASRSVSVILAYLMKTENLSYPDAYRRVKSSRSAANPNASFVMQLSLYEESIRSEKAPK